MIYAVIGVLTVILVCLLCFLAAIGVSYFDHFFCQKKRGRDLVETVRDEVFEDIPLTIIAGFLTFLIVLFIALGVYVFGYFLYTAFTSMGVEL